MMNPLLYTSLLLLSIVSASLAGFGGPDTYGYTWRDSNAGGGPVYQWVGLPDGRVVMEAGHPDPGKVVPIYGPPVVFYGKTETAVMMVSKNGYVTFDVADTGGDSTNDCPFPALPNKDSARRIAVLHDNLDFNGGVVGGSIFDGRILQQYFPTSPHPHHSCGVTVISWLNMVHAGSAERFSFQLLLFDNFDILMQFGENPENGSGSSTGLQENGNKGLSVACDTAGSIPDNYAVLFEPPTFEVTSLQDDFGAGGTSLRSLVLPGVAGQKIVFDPSLSGGTIRLDETLTVLGYGLRFPVSIDASALPDGITLDGHSEVPLYFANGRTHFSNVSFLVGKGVDGFPNGGLVVDPVPTSNTSAALTVSNCHFQGNESADTVPGGGLTISDNSDAFVYGSNFEANSAGWGAGINVRSGGDVRVEDCRFRLNTAIIGGGGMYNGGVATVNGCEFSDNVANFGGGINFFQGEDGISQLRTNMTVAGCLFFANDGSVSGGGIAVGGVLTESPIILIESSTFTENTSGTGSALRVAHGSAYLSHSTFNANESSAIAIQTAEFGYFDHCIFSGSDDYFTGAGTIVSNGFNVADLDTIFVNPDDIEDVGDVMLAPLASNGGPTRTHALLPSSPAIDAGDPSIADEPDTDARGYDRVVDGTIDVGAYEFAGNLVVTTAVDEDANPGEGLSLREAVRDAAPGSIVTFDPALNGATIALGGSAITIDRDVAVDASALVNGIKVDAGGASGVMVVGGASAVSLINLDLSGGSQTGGIDGGGGLRVETHSDVSMIDGSVRGCTSDKAGGGVSVLGKSNLWMVDCVVAGNETTGADTSGGGINVVDAGLEMQRTTVRSNVSIGAGGGIRATLGADISLGSCTIAGNTAGGSGGGISTAGGSNGLVTNSTISGNSAGGPGGGFYGYDADFKIEFCTIANNRAVSTAGGIVAGSFQTGYRQTLTHCIVAANRLVGTGLLNIRAFVQDAEPLSAGYNLIDDDSFSNAGPTDMEGRVAYLAPLANYGSNLQTHALLAISPAIDAGDPIGDGAPAKDQRGYSRLADGRNVGVARIDLGAHEAAAPVFVGDLLDVEDGVGQRSLRGAITAAEDGGRILFKQLINGGMIDLSTAAGGQGTQLLVDKSIQIDATALSDGITISGGDESRVFDITGGADVAMHALRIEDGFTGAIADGGGFRVSGNANLLLTHSSVSGNRARDGGAFHVSGGGSAHLQNVTVSGNTAQREGATMKLDGAAGSATLEHCSVVDQLLAGGGSVGGFALGAGKLTLYSTLLADIPDIMFSSDDLSNITSLGYNLADDGSAIIGAGILVAPSDQTGVNPNVTPLQDPGGWSKVHRYQASSALRNAGDPEPSLLPSLSATGGVRSVGRMDIGAEERNGRAADADGDQMPDYWENLFGFEIDDSMDAAEDADGDGDSNLAEFQNGTNPLRSDLVIVVPRILHVEVLPNGNLGVEFTSQGGVTYQFDLSTDLKSWQTIGSREGILGASTTEIEAGAQTFERYYLRVRVLGLE